MKVYLVNLDRDIVKLEKVDRRLRELGVVYERISAVNGKDLSSEEVRKSVNAFRWWCSMGRKAGLGEIGCAFSHFVIYEKLADAECCCILEDDVLLDDRFVEQLSRVSQWIDVTKPIVVMLSNRTTDVRSCNDFEVSKVHSDHGTFGYVITGVAAQAIMRVNRPLKRPCDHWQYWDRHGLISLYRAYPTVCGHDDDVVSGTAPTWAIKLAEMSVTKRVVYKLGRLLGKTLDRVLPT